MKVEIGTYTPAEKSNELLEVVDALIAAKSDENPQPEAKLRDVPTDKVNSTKRLMREAANARNLTARQTGEEEGKGGVTLRYILVDKITRARKTED